MGFNHPANPTGLLKEMNFGDFTLSNFKLATIGDNIVVTLR
jgi:hypothetical protein